ncbi:MAG: hypothetical protein VZS44_11875 [Bacilli bacterium]|nr:hypothetical protein [Bacilli bacterium]
MKKFMILIAFMAINIACNAQMFEAPKKAKTEWKDSITTFTYKTNKGEVCKVFVSRRGSYYYYTKNKKGELRKYYIPKDIQIKMGRKYDK